MESEHMFTPKEKSPLPEAQRRVEPMTLHYAGQRAQQSTYWAILVPFYAYDFFGLPFWAAKLIFVNTVNHRNV